jgi:hypothetical protein
LQNFTKETDFPLLHLGASIGFSYCVYSIQKHMPVAQNIQNQAHEPIAYPTMTINAPHGNFVLDHGSTLVNMAPNTLIDPVFVKMFAYMAIGSVSIFSMDLVGIISNYMTRYSLGEEWENTLTHVGSMIGSGVGVYVSTFSILPYCYATPVSCAFLIIPIVAIDSVFETAFQRQDQVKAQTDTTNELQNYHDIPQDMCLYVCMIEIVTKFAVPEIVSNILKDNEEDTILRALQAAINPLPNAHYEEPIIESNKDPLEAFNPANLQAVCNAIPFLTNYEICMEI